MPRKVPNWSGKPGPFPQGIEPMLLQVAPAPFHNSAWTFEPKLDGYRIIAYLNKGNARLITRGGADYSHCFPGIITTLAAQPVQAMVLDAEIVAFENGKPSFSVLQQVVNARIAARGNEQTVLFCFDFLHIEGLNSRGERQSERRRMLEAALVPSTQVQLVHAEEDGIALFKAAGAMGLEGIVAKRKDSPYRPGARSGDWLKVLLFKKADLIIVGYTGERTVMSLLVAYRRGGKLKYAANVSAGLGNIAKSLMPLLKTVPQGAPRGNVAGAHWLEPMLVAGIRYRELTREGKLRHPEFYRMKNELAPEAPDFSDELL